MGFLGFLTRLVVLFYFYLFLVYSEIVVVVRLRVESSRPWLSFRPRLSSRRYAARYRYAGLCAHRYAGLKCALAYMAICRARECVEVRRSITVHDAPNSFSGYAPGCQLYVSYFVCIRQGRLYGQSQVQGTCIASLMPSPSILL